MVLKKYDAVARSLNASGQWVALLPIRALLAYEFWNAGYGKFTTGTEAPRWFANQDFVFPFGLLSANMNWFMVTWGELLAAVGIALGLFTRFFAFSLLVITVVAIAAVHWPASWDSVGQLWEGYSVSRVMDEGEFRGNFRIPFLFLAMTLPLIFFGGGKFSLDHLLVARLDTGRLTTSQTPDSIAFALAGFVFGIILLYLVPGLGVALVLASAVALMHGLYSRSQVSSHGTL